MSVFCTIVYLAFPSFIAKVEAEVSTAALEAALFSLHYAVVCTGTSFPFLVVESVVYKTSCAIYE